MIEINRSVVEGRAVRGFLMRVNSSPPETLTPEQKHAQNLDSAYTTALRMVRTGDKFGEDALKKLQGIIVKDHKHIPMWYKGEYCLKKRKS